MASSPPRRPWLHGHAALVVGGGRGIGAATAVHLARAGADVAVAARSGSEVTRISDQVVAEGGNAMPWRVDVREPEQVDHLIDQVLRRFGRLDHVVYCAGYLPDAAFVWEVDPAEVRTTLDVNVLGPLHLAQHVVPHMLMQGQGTLVFLTSALPRWSLPGLGTYAASRAAENTLVRTLATEVRGSGLGVYVFTPPPTETSALRQFRASLPGRGATGDGAAGIDPDEVGRAVVRLCLLHRARPAGDALPSPRYPRPFHWVDPPRRRHRW